MTKKRNIYTFKITTTSILILMKDKNYRWFIGWAVMAGIVW